MSALYVTDPATNERVTLSELARRHGIHVSTLSRRYSEGKRGQALIDAVDIAAKSTNQHAANRAAAERREAIINASTRGLHLPFNQLGGIRHA